MTAWKKHKKKIIAATAVLLLAAAGGCWWYFGAPSGDAVYVTPVSVGEGWGFGTLNRFSGVVEPQATVDVNPDGSKTVGEVYVEVGDEVKEGDKLFSYDTASLNLEVMQMQLDIQRIEGEITTNRENITQLEAEKAAAGADMQLEYTLQIQQLQNSNQSLQYSLKAKRNELSQLRSTLKNADVTSPISGKVTHVSSTEEAQYGSDAFITVMQSGEFLIRGTASELNLHQLSQGAAVLIRSRVDDTTWTGTISQVETTPAGGDSSNNFGNGSVAGSKYNFFVQLDTSEGLFIGQHVTVELGGAEQGSGLMLSEMYICDLGTEQPYVWRDNGGRLQKSVVELGSYNEMTMEYEILSGLSAEDYIAFPSEELREGMKTTTEYVEPQPDEGGMGDMGDMGMGAVG